MQQAAINVDCSKLSRMSIYKSQEYRKSPKKLKSNWESVYSGNTCNTGTFISISFYYTLFQHMLSRSSLKHRKMHSICDHVGGKSDKLQDIIRESPHNSDNHETVSETRQQFSNGWMDG